MYPVLSVSPCYARTIFGKSTQASVCVVPALNKRIGFASFDVQRWAIISPDLIIIANNNIIGHCIIILLFTMCCRCAMDETQEIERQIYASPRGVHRGFVVNLFVDSRGTSSPCPKILQFGLNV